MNNKKLLVKMLIAMMIIFYCSIASAFSNPELYQAAIYADDSARNARKALFSDDLDEANYFARKSKNDAYNCESSLNHARYDIFNNGNYNAIKIINMAILSIQEAESFAKKAQYASNLEEVYFYADKACKAANQAESFIRQIM